MLSDKACILFHPYREPSYADRALYRIVFRDGFLSISLKPLNIRSIPPIYLIKSSSPCMETSILYDSRVLKPKTVQNPKRYLSLFLNPKL